MARIDYRDREYNPTENRLRELLVGKRISEITRDELYGTLTLDDGTVLHLHGNEGCGGCANGWYDLTALNKTDSAIMDVRIEEHPTDDYTHHETGYYRIFVLSFDKKKDLLAKEELLAEFMGSDGNGYYGTGYWIAVIPDPA